MEESMHLSVGLEPKDARGYLNIYSCPRSICPHVNWGLSEIFKTKIELDWQPQTLINNSFCAELNWIGPIGLSSRITSNLAKWGQLRLDCLQEPSKFQLGERFSVTPKLGIFRTEINYLGESVVTENKLKSAFERSQTEKEEFSVELAFLLGTPWDEDLEPFRITKHDSSVKWISKTG